MARKRNRNYIWVYSKWPPIISECSLDEFNTSLGSAAFSTANISMSTTLLCSINRWMMLDCHFFPGNFNIIFTMYYSMNIPFLCGLRCFFLYQFFFHIPLVYIFVFGLFLPCSNALNESLSWLKNRIEVSVSPFLSFSLQFACPIIFFLIFSPQKIQLIFVYPDISIKKAIFFGQSVGMEALYWVVNTFPTMKRKTTTKRIKTLYAMNVEFLLSMWNVSVLVHSNLPHIHRMISLRCTEMQSSPPIHSIANSAHERSKGNGGEKKCNKERCIHIIYYTIL